MGSGASTGEGTDGSAGRSAGKDEDGEARAPETGESNGADAEVSSGRRPALLLGLGAATGLVLAVASLLADDPTPGSLPEGAVALVNGHVIRAEDYRRLIAGLERDLRGPIDDDRRRHVLDRMIEEELLVQRAIALGLARLDRQVRSGLTSAVIQSVVAAAEDREPGDSELAEFYAENRAFFALPPRLRVRQIFLRLPTDGDEEAVRARAREARALWRDGGTFEVVRAGFGDGEISPVPNALLPPAKLREYVGPTALSAVLALEPGEISEPIRSGVGLHVIELVEREPEHIPELAAIRDRVAAEWRRRQGDAALRSYLDELRDESDVQVVEQLP